MSGTSDQPRRGVRARAWRAAPAHPPERRALGRAGARAHRGLHVDEPGRHRGARPAGEAGVVRGRPQVPDAPAHPRRAERAGRPRFSFDRQLFAATARRHLGELPRQLGPRDGVLEAIFADWGHHEVQDLLAGVDQVVASGVPIPMARRGGWSYGGILTDYTIASDTRFKAAVSGAGGASPGPLRHRPRTSPSTTTRSVRPCRTSKPRDQDLGYPLLHADRIHTPTLFIGGEHDFNVPCGGEQMYEALRSLGVETQSVI